MHSHSVDCGMTRQIMQSATRYVNLAANEKTKGFRVADFARSRTLAPCDFRYAKDRLVLVSPSRWEIPNIFRAGAVDREDGFSSSGGLGFVDHVQRINRRVPGCVRLFDKVSSGQPRAWNGWGALYKRSTGRRLAESRALPNY